MRRGFYFICGILALGLGVVGAFLPLLPTVPFMILAAFFFARSSPAFERRILEDPRFGPHIRAWREKGAINRTGKIAALLAFAASALIGVAFMEMPWMLAPVFVALVGGTWIWTRPEA